ncbi:MAG: Lrp/AsnC family transcriptional regulator [Proteobacteria bacterium]|nr:Lrp/AsnC family transcriptional regulator [Pseudomonadota bacterium]
MDEINRRLLALLSENARLPIKSLAAEVGLARSSVRERIARLEAEGVIRGYRAEIAPQPEGALLRAFLIVKLAKTPARELVARIARMPGVRQCLSVSGEIDVVVEIAGENTGALNALRDAISVLPQVADLTTAIILKDEMAGLAR